MQHAGSGDSLLCKVDGIGVCRLRHCVAYEVGAMGHVSSMGGSGGA